MTNDTLWQTKLAARIDDPAEKALVLLRDPAGHQNGSSRALRQQLAARVAYSASSRSAGSISAIRSKSRSSVSSGTPYSITVAAIKQSCGLRGVMPAQRQRAYSAPASAWVAAVAGNIGTASKCQRRRSIWACERAPCSISWSTTGAINASPSSNNWRKRATGGVADCRNRSTQTEVSTKITGHAGTHRTHVVRGVEQRLTHQIENLALATACDKLAQRLIDDVLLAARITQPHGFFDERVIQNNIGPHGIHLLMCMVAQACSDRLTPRKDLRQ